MAEFSALSTLLLAGTHPPLCSVTLCASHTLHSDFQPTRTILILTVPWKAKKERVALDLEQENRDEVYRGWGDRRPGRDEKEEKEEEESHRALALRWTIRRGALATHDSDASGRMAAHNFIVTKPVRWIPDSWMSGMIESAPAAPKASSAPYVSRCHICKIARRDRLLL